MVSRPLRSTPEMWTRVGYIQTLERFHNTRLLTAAIDAVIPAMVINVT